MQKKIGKLDSGKVYILTMRNDVAHSTAIKMEAARFCKKVGHPGTKGTSTYDVQPLSFCLR